MTAKTFSSRRGAVICGILCALMLVGLVFLTQTDAHAADTAPADITVFEASANTNVASFYNSATLSKIYSGELDARDGIALVGISKDTGDIEMLSASKLSYVKSISDGYEYYLQVKNFDTFMESVIFNFDANTLKALGIRQTQDVNGDRTWDLSMYRGIEVELYVPSDVYGADDTYGFLLRIDCGKTADGWAYYKKALETKGSYFTENGGYYTFKSEIAEMQPLVRCPDAAAMGCMALNFSGWSGMVGLNKTGSVSDGYAVYIKSIKLVDAVPSEIGGWCGEDVSWALDDGGTLTISGSGAMNYYSEYQRYPWYPYRSSIKRVIISEGVTEIGAFAFADLHSLTSLVIARSVESIGASAFSACDSLTSITVPNGVKSIGSHAFADCDALTGVYISDVAAWCGISFENEYSNPLFYAKKLYINGSADSNIVIPEGVTGIGAYAFLNCRSLKNVTIPASVTSIGTDAFRYCNSLTGAYISDLAAWCGISFSNEYSNPSYYANIYLNKVLQTRPVIPDGVTSISAYAFYKCGVFTSITIPESVTSIGEYAFWGCDYLGSVTVGGAGIVGGITSSDAWGYLVNNANTVIIKADITDIGSYITTNFTKFGDVMLDGVQYDIYTKHSQGTAGKVWTVASGKCGAALSWSLDSSGTLTISGTGAMSYCSMYQNYPWYPYRASIKRIVVGDGVTAIGGFAFSDCINLTSVSIGAAVTELKANMFYGSRRSLESITVSESNAVYHSAGNCAINTASKILILGCKNSVIPCDGSVTCIGDNAFLMCNNGFTSISIPGSVTRIEANSFYDCGSLKLVIIDRASIASGLSSYDACGYLVYYAKTVAVKGDITNVGSYITSNFKKVNTVMIDGVKYNVYSKHAHGEDSTNWTITADGHKGCSECGLTADPEGIKWTFDEATGTLTISGWGEMDGYAAATMPWFDIAADIKKVVICEGVTSIGKNAFNNEKAGFVFGEIELPSTLTSIGNYAFYYCSELKNIKLPASLESIGKFAFRKTGLTSVELEGSSGWIIGDEGTLGFASEATVIEALINRHHDKVWTAAAEGAEVRMIIAIGGCGKKLVWMLDDTGLLTVTGSGAMYDYATGAAPWISYKAQIKSVIIGEGVTSIGNCAFYGCTKLSDAVISASVKSIGRYAFRKAKLTDITFEGENGWSIDGDAYAFDNTAATLEALVYRLYDKKWTAIEAPEAKVIALGKCGESALWILRDTGTLNIIGSGAIYDYGTDGAPWVSYRDTVKSVIIGEGVTEIGKKAFYGCANITSVSLPSTLTSIGNYAFYSCKGLGEVTVPAAVSTIGKYAFRKAGLSSVILEGTSRWSIEGEVISFANSAEVAKALISSYYTKVWTVYIAPPVSGVTVSDASVTLTEGDDVLVSADVQPEDADDRSVIWSSANTDIATVSGGVITAVGVGETDITVTTVDGGYQATVHVTVLARHIDVSGVSVSVGALELEKGGTATVTATVFPSNATDKSLIWSSSDESVVTVSGGVITAVGGGSATVTVTTVEGGYTAEVSVTVIRRGELTGRVYSASSRELLSGVSVKLYKDGSLVASAVSDSTGNYGFSNVRYGAYKLIYSCENYLDYDLAYTVASESAQIENVYLALDASTLPGYASGYAKNATTGLGISGITVYVRSGSGATTGDVLQTLTTNSSGYYITSGLAAGNYTLQFVDERSAVTPFTTASINVTVSGNETSEENNISLVQPISDDEFRIVLTWGETPSDLDSHLLISSGSNEYHVYYWDKTPSGAGANLDVDDTSSYGPETVTVTAIKANGVYRYYVHNYSRNSLTGITNSGAVVNIYIGGEVHSLSAPTGSGYYWDVFTYDAATGMLTITNKIVDEAPSL